MGAHEDVVLLVLTLASLFLMISSFMIANKVLSGLFTAGAMYSSSVRAGLIAGCMSVSNMHDDINITIHWNFLPVDIATSTNLVVAATDQIGWVAFPGIITSGNC